VLHSLEKKGLITTFKKQRKTYFRAESPNKVLTLLEQRSVEVNQAKTSFAKILPKLTSAYKMTIGKPAVRYFEGEEGVKEVFTEVYQTKDKIVWGCVDIDRAEEGLKNYIIPNLLPLRLKQKSWSYSLTADTPTARVKKKDDAKELRKQVFLDPKKYPLPAEIDVYEDKIAMMNFRQGDFIGLVVEDRDFAQSLKSIFQFVFDRLYQEKE
jgi:sugar-specific transcriptional regulator TrmB